MERERPATSTRSHPKFGANQEARKRSKFPGGTAWGNVCSAVDNVICSVLTIAVTL